MLILVFPDQYKIVFTTKVALYIKFGLKEVKDVLWLSVDSLANGPKVRPGGSSRTEMASHWVLDLLVLGFFVIFVLVLHLLLYSDKKIQVVVNHVALYSVEIKSL